MRPPSHTIDAIMFAEALDACRSFLPSTGSFPLLLYADTTTLTLFMAHARSTFRLFVPCQGTSPWPTPIAVTGLPLFQTASRFTDAFTIERTPTALRLVNGSFSITLALHPSPDLTIPSIVHDNPDDEIATIRIPAIELLPLLHATFHATAVDTPTDPHQDGILFESHHEHLRLIATDGRRLVSTRSHSPVLTSPHDPLPDRTAIVSRADIATILTALGLDHPQQEPTIVIRLGRRGYTFTGHAWTLTGSYLPGPYPAWRQVVDPLVPTPASCTVKRDLLGIALQRAAHLIAPFPLRSVSITLLRDTMAIQVRFPQGDSTNAIPAHVDPACIGQHVTLDVTQLIPLLRAFTGDHVILSLPLPHTPAPLFLTAPEDPTIALLLPSTASSSDLFSTTAP